MRPSCRSLPSASTTHSATTASIAGALEFCSGSEDGAEARRADRRLRDRWTGRWESSALPAGTDAAGARRRSSRSSTRAAWSPRRARADGGRHGGVTDSHAHLDACDEPAAALDRARAGSRRHADRHDRHRHRVEPGGARDRRARTRASHAALGSTRIRPRQPEAERLAELRELLAHPKAVAVGETGARHGPSLRDTRASSAASSTRSSLSPTSSASRSSSTTARRTTRRPLLLLRSPARWSSTASRRPALVMTAVERGYYVSFAGNVTFPNAVALREAASAVPADRILVETDSPYLAPQPMRGARNEPANVVHTVACLAEARRAPRSRPSPPRRTRMPPQHSGWHDASRPKKALGQHFLVDENILGVIERLQRSRLDGRRARGRPGSRHPHAPSRRASGSSTSIELDRSLEPELRAALGAYSNVRLIWETHSSSRSTSSSRTDQARRQPPVQRRDSARGRDPRARTVAASAGA